MKSYPVPSYGDHFVNHPCGFLFNNQDSLPESVLRQSGVSGNVSSKDFFWRAYGIHMLTKNSSKWLFTRWKLTNVPWKLMVEKIVPFQGRHFYTFWGGGGCLRKYSSNTFQRRKPPKISKSTFNDPYGLWLYDFLQTWIHQSKIRETQHFGKQGTGAKKTVLVAIELKLQFP